MQLSAVSHYSSFSRVSSIASFPDAPFQTYGLPLFRDSGLLHFMPLLLFEPGLLLRRYFHRAYFHKFLLQHFMPPRYMPIVSFTSARLSLAHILGASHIACRAAFFCCIAAVRRETRSPLFMAYSRHRVRPLARRAVSAGQIRHAFYLCCIDKQACVKPRDIEEVI